MSPSRGRIILVAAPPPVLLEKIAAFVRDPDSHDFDDLVRLAVAAHYERRAAFRKLCSERGITPERVDSWLDVPALTSDFIDSDEAATPRLSPTEQAAIDASWTRYCLDAPTHPPVLSLFLASETEHGRRTAAPVAHLLERWGSMDSLSAIGPRGVDAKKARGFLAARQRDGQPVLIVASSTTLGELVASLQRLDLRFRLSAASVVVEMVEVTDLPGDRAGEVHGLIEEFLAIPPNRFVRLLGVAGASTQMFTDSLADGDAEVFVPPHWVRLSLIDPGSKEVVAPGEPGLLRVFDLANLDQSLHLETEIRGVLGPDGFRLLEPVS